MKKLMKTGFAAMAFIAFSMITSCKDSSQNSKNEDAPATRIDGKWQSQHDLMAGTGSGGVTIEFHEDGTCQILVLMQRVKTAISTNADEIVELTGKWQMKDGIIVTNMTINAWQTIFPNGEIRPLPKTRFFWSTFRVV